MADDEEEEEEDVNKTDDRIDVLKEDMAENIAEHLGVDKEDISGMGLDNWEEEYRKFRDDPIGNYRESIKHSEKMIEEYGRRIKMHKKKIARLEGLIEAERIDEVTEDG